MKARIEKEALQRALDEVTRVADEVVVLRPWEKFLRIEGRSAELTDVQIMLADCSGDPLAVPVATLRSVVGACSMGAIKLDSSSVDIRVTDSAGTTFNLRTVADANMAKLAMPEPDVVLHFDVFRAALRRVVPYTRRDESTLLSGVMLAPHDDGLVVLGTDRFRGARVVVPGVGISDNECLMPNLLLDELMRRESYKCGVTLKENTVSFRLDRSILSGSLMDASEYPTKQLLKLINLSHDNVCVFDAEGFTECAKKVVAIGEVTKAQMHFDPDAGSVAVMATSPRGSVSAEFSAVYTGAMMDVWLNPPMADALFGSIGTEGIRLEMSQRIGDMIGVTGVGLIDDDLEMRAVMMPVVQKD